MEAVPRWLPAGLAVRRKRTPLLWRGFSGYGLKLSNSVFCFFLFFPRFHGSCSVLDRWLLPARLATLRGRLVGVLRRASCGALTGCYNGGLCRYHSKGDFLPSLIHRRICKGLLYLRCRRPVPSRGACGCSRLKARQLGRSSLAVLRRGCRVNCRWLPEAYQ